MDSEALTQAMATETLTEAMATQATATETQLMEVSALVPDTSRLINNV